MGLCGLTVNFLQTSNSYYENSHVCCIETSFISKQNKHGVLCLHCASEDRMWSLQIQPLWHSQVADWVSQIPCSKLTNRRWRMIVWLVHNVFGSMWKAIILTFLEVVSQYLPGGTDESSDLSVRKLRNVTPGCSIVTSSAWTWVGGNFKIVLEKLRMQVLTKLNHSRILSMYLLWVSLNFVKIWVNCQVFKKTVLHWVSEILLVGQFACRQFMSSVHVTENVVWPASKTNKIM